MKSVRQSEMPIVTRIALCIVTTLALASAFHSYLSADQTARHYQDPQMTCQLGIQADRFRGAMEIIPADAVVEYMSDLQMRRDAHWPANEEFIFTAVRYALAPRALIPYQSGQKQAWVLGNFLKPVDLNQIEKENGLKLVKDFGAGVVVFRNEQ